MLNGRSILSGEGYGSLGTIYLAFVLGHPIHTKDDIQTILSQNNEISKEPLSKDINGGIFARVLGMGKRVGGLD